MVYKKFVTFSFDDGVTQDRRLIQLLDRYRLKGTFNLNSALLGLKGTATAGGRTVKHDKVYPNEIKDLYKNHEVAVHTLTHPNLRELDDETIIWQVEQDRRMLSMLAGKDVIGMAYPCGGENYNDRVMGILSKHTGIQYARTIKSTYSFAIPLNVYEFHPVAHIMEKERVFDLGNQFLDIEEGLFCLWGHSYELDFGFDMNWESLEELFILISGKEDIFYGTNKEILEMIA